jgi:hypothetical protein
VIKPYQSAQILAQKLLAEAAESEPQITADLKTIASEIFAEMVGLENRFKSLESLTRKIIDMIKINLQAIEEIDEKINDALRYTLILSVEKYADSYHKTIETLWESGYFVPEKRIWNAWENIGTPFDKGYRGINITVISSQKQIFELQFHTEESFRLKNETHSIYEEMRDKNISKEREIELVKTMRAKAAEVKRPKGI